MIGLEATRHRCRQREQQGAERRCTDRFREYRFAHQLRNAKKKAEPNTRLPRPQSAARRGLPLSPFPTLGATTVLPDPPHKLIRPRTPVAHDRDMIRSFHWIFRSAKRTSDTHLLEVWRPAAGRRRKLFLLRSRCRRTRPSRQVLRTCSRRRQAARRNSGAGMAHGSLAPPGAVSRAPRSPAPGRLPVRASVPAGASAVPEAHENDGDIEVPEPPRPRPAQPRPALPSAWTSASSPS